MRPTKGTTPVDDRWRSHRFAALFLRAAIFLVPLSVGFLVGRTVAARLPETQTAVDVAVWWVTVITASTIAATLTDRLARRLLPLTILLKMTMLFPDRAPSRMRVALRSGNFTELRKRIDRAQAGEDVDLGEMSELILSLSTALSRHDRKTRGHSERTRAYTDIIAEEMGLAEEARDKLRWAALLHDVGKLEVPADILNKDSKLTDEEWHIVRQHPVYGMKLVGPLIPWLGEWAKTIEHHHERFDGTGYPHGLAGTDIALGARIVSVGDAYDVMTSGRAYQRAQSPAAARREIARMSGAQFDPVVVRALMNVSLGRLQLAAGPLAMLVELPFIRGLPQVGRDAATLLTSSALMATSIAAGVIPLPEAFLPDVVVDAVVTAGEFALPPDEPTETPPTTSPQSTTTVPAEESTTSTTVATSTTTTITPTPSTTTATMPGAPSVVNDSVTTSEGRAVTVDVLANDEDPGSGLDPSSLLVSSQPSIGSARVIGRMIEYTPHEGRHGQDRLRYRICNLDGICAEADLAVTVTPVNDPPVVHTTSGAVDEDTTLTLTLEVSDPEGDPVTCRLAASPSTGAATIPADCSKVVFQPSADFNGLVDLVIEISDGELSTRSTIIITVRPVNDAPVAVDDSAAVDWISTIDIPVLANDFDVDGDPLTLTITTGPASGTATVVGSNIRYVPTFGAGGTFAITYRICDPSGACASATATVTVAGVTVANDDTAATPLDTPVVIRAVDNDSTAVGTWARASFRITSPPSNGTAEVLGGGRVRYTPADGFAGTDSLVYQLCDNQRTCDTATVTITVG
jgi:HD-GYP domain-containing protein (c-di-GMP phosphodiesterase class II)